MTTRPIRKLTFFVTAALTAACAAGDADPVPPVEVAASDYAFTVPATVPGGFVHVNFANRGREDHHAQIMRLNDGVTRDQFKATLASVLQAVATEGEGAFMKIFEVGTLAGGPGMVAPGRNVDVVAELPAGEYVLLCFVSGPDGVPHVVKDMVQYFTVTAPAADAPAAPTPTVSVDLADFAFSDLPEMRAGRTTIEVRNGGPEPHELIVLKLEGVTLAQLMEKMATPQPVDSAQMTAPPYTAVGGVQGLMPGAKGWVTLDLTPGNYAIVCFIPSVANGGQPHVALGMSKEFTVAGN